jgi:DNA ligase-1
MKILEFSTFLNQIELTTSRLEMTDILSNLFTESSPEEIDKVVYLSLGRLVPLFEAVEFGISDKLMVRIIAQAFGVEANEVEKEYKTVGDLGNVAEGKFKKQDTKHKSQ